ncbi:hypothetical protein QBC44DRAFT_320070 [Cladorrhinum sp. PSN332]|nr:hypothetical protein QBC44DRAFT_320070 [Cladorrhinum sp. PSN332]
MSFLWLASCGCRWYPLLTISFTLRACVYLLYALPSAHMLVYLWSVSDWKPGSPSKVAGVWMLDAARSPRSHGQAPQTRQPSPASQPGTVTLAVRCGALVGRIAGGFGLASHSLAIPLTLTPMD